VKAKLVVAIGRQQHHGSAGTGVICDPVGQRSFEEAFDSNRVNSKFFYPSGRRTS